MGKIKKICKETHIGGGMYDNSARLELQECIHYHHRDLRLFFDKENFLRTCELFAEAKRKYDELGQPETLNEMVQLSNVEFDHNSTNNRLGIEIQHNDTVHIHYNDLRVHMTLGDLMIWFDTFEKANHNLSAEYIELLYFDQCNYHDVVNEYVNALKEYEKRPSSYKIFSTPQHIKNVIIYEESDVGNYFKRNMGLPEDYPQSISKELDYEYLFTLYEAIKKYGYAERPFYRKYMVAYKLKEKPYIVNAHRLAVLKSLGYKGALCYLVPKESNWEDE